MMDDHPDMEAYHVKFTDQPVNRRLVTERVLLWPFLVAMVIVLLGRVRGIRVCVTLDPHFMGSPGTTVTLRGFLRSQHRPANNATVMTLGELMAWFRGWHWHTTCSIIAAAAP